MLDEFKVKPPAGFPDHPHRGFETVSYVLKGTGQHEDFCGHKGALNSGDVQWMTCGRGIVHCEMPQGTDEAHGLQLWVNLAKKNKMIEPAYQELLDKDIPRSTENGTTIKVIAGKAFGKTSPMYTRTPTMYLDFKMQKGSSVDQPIPTGWNSFIYVLSGSAHFGNSDKPTPGKPYDTLVLSEEGDFIHISNLESDTCHFVLIGGQPLNEPVAQYGPFVMNTDEEIEQALLDYKLGQNGFENAKTWKSEYLKNG
ncbi:pirin-like isoform X2 [Mytilus trossulus]